MNVSVVFANRWGNEYFKPTKFQKEKLKEIFKENNLDFDG